MRAVVQRVSSARVEVGAELAGAIGEGLLVYLGVALDDGPADLEWMADKLPNLRIFPDASGSLNLSLLDRGGSLLLVSQFTLLADARKGRRPSFSAAAGPELARSLYEGLAERLRGAGLRVELGRFREEMEVASVNSGPVTILLDSKRAF